MDKEDWILLCAIVFGCSLLTGIFVYGYKDNYYHREAVERGFAHYETDSYGNSAFTWNTNAPQK